MRRLITLTLAPALALTASCEKKADEEKPKTADQIDPAKNPWNADKLAAGDASIGVDAAPAIAVVIDAGAAPPPTPGGESVRPPTAADLAEYTKDLPGTGKKLLAKIETNHGVLNCELFGDKAPMTVANFIGLATGKKAWKDPRTGKTIKATPYFDGLKFHRVMQGFMIQGGDPLGNGTGGPGYAMDQETYPDLIHEPGTLSMANTGRPHSSGSQFFIMEARNKGLDGSYSVFGKCKEVDLVKKITAYQKPGTDLPSKLVTIDKVTISKGK
jgi:cyclophilin family peptidyl-prolyl cis-trans isomerase